jgi:hypothetical protein
MPSVPLERKLENYRCLAANCREMAANLLSEASKNERKANEIWEMIKNERKSHQDA